MNNQTLLINRPLLLPFTIHWQTPTPNEIILFVRLEKTWPESLISAPTSLTALGFQEASVKEAADRKG
jgi:hypothetical protein